MKKKSQYFTDNDNKRQTFANLFANRLNSNNCDLE